MIKVDKVILAAGKGTRMRSSKPKVAHCIAGKPMLAYLLELQLNNHYQTTTHIVVGHGAQQIKDHFTDATEATCNWVEQQQQLGTGHAVQQVLPDLDEDSIVLILAGDVPLIQQNTVQALLEKVTHTSMALLTFEMGDATGYGRIVRDKGDQVTAIVEHKDATDQQREIAEINTGIMAVSSRHLLQWLPNLKNDNAQGEYYLTDLIALSVAAGVKVETINPTYGWEVDGINDKLQLQKLERQWQQFQVTELVRSGLQVADIQRVDIRGKLECGTDCFADINTIFEGNVTLGDNVSIGANSIITNSTIGNDVVVHPNSIIDNATVSNNVQIGPFARLRPDTYLSDGAKIGNFVETKNAYVGEGSKINHLSYVGDAQIGKNANIGAGVITCNYDGANKHITTIKDNAFIGSNASLVAPVTIGEGAVVGAGSTITKEVSAEALGLTRAPQREMANYQRAPKAEK